MAARRVVPFARAGLGALLALVLGLALWFVGRTPAPLAPLAPTSAPAGVGYASASIAASAGVSASKSATRLPKLLEKPLWQELSESQRAALLPLAAEWDRIEGVRKKKWLEVAVRFPSMTHDEQQRLHERMRVWTKLTPEQRRLARENYSRVQKIAPPQKSVEWEQYQQLPEEQKQRLATEAKAKKQVVNLPTTTQSKIKTVAPVKSRAPSASTIVSPTVSPPVPPGAPVPATGSVKPGQPATVITTAPSPVSDTSTGPSTPAASSPANVK